MKVECNNPVFNPVTITLETQKEVDKLYAILVHHSINDSLEIGGWWKQLKPYRTDSYEHYFENLCEGLEKEYGGSK